MSHICHSGECRRTDGPHACHDPACIVASANCASLVSRLLKLPRYTSSDPRHAPGEFVKWDYIVALVAEARKDGTR